MIQNSKCDNETTRITSHATAVSLNDSTQLIEWWLW